MQRRRKIPTLIAIVFLVVGVAAGVFLVQQRALFRLSASGDFAPQDIRITNISDNSFTVSWYTNRNAIAGVFWGGSPETSEFASAQDTSQKRVHYVNVGGLAPDTNYYFKISSGGDTFENAGVPWIVKTAPKLRDPKEPRYASGRAFAEFGTAAAGTVVYIQVGGAAPASAQVSENGAWLIPISTIRTQSLSDYVNITEDTVLEIVVQGGPLGVATAQIHALKAHPTPDITLGNSYDFRNFDSLETTYQPNARVDLPTDESGGSRFEITQEAPTPQN